jgi:hypothetical protein
MAQQHDLDHELYKLPMGFRIFWSPSTWRQRKKKSSTAYRIRTKEREKFSIH